MSSEPWKNAPTHGRAHANAVMAALALMTNSCASGVVRADVPFRVDGDRARLALLEVATAMQTEVSLSIFVSDPLIADASRQFAAIVQERGRGNVPEEAVLMTDRIIHELVSMLDGRGPQINEIAEWIVKRGEVPLAEIALHLQLPLDPDC